MKFHNKLHFPFLILAAIIFCGQELLHPIFHAHTEIHPCCSQHSEELKTKKSAGIKHNDNSTQHISHKNTCPICNSIANKSTQPISAEKPLINRKFLAYSQIRESLSFNFYYKPTSRGPPTV